MNTNLHADQDNRSDVFVGIYLFDEVEVLDFAGPFEVFSTASRMLKRDKEDPARVFEVITISENADKVTARAGLMLNTSATIERHPTLDVLIVPGGVVTAQLEKTHVIDWITNVSLTTQVTASICTGAFLLAKAGLLDGIPATTHWEDLDDLQRMFPKVKVQGQVRWVDNGKIITAAGISAGIDMSLHLVSRLFDRDLAQRTARQMDYHWQETN